MVLFVENSIYSYSCVNTESILFGNIKVRELEEQQNGLEEQVTVLRKEYGDLKHEFDTEVNALNQIC
jgi:SHS2 domain-containing protein